MNRRQFLAALGLTTVGTIAQNSRAMANSPAWIPSDHSRPKIPYGIMSGDIRGNQAVIWSKSDRLSRMVIDYSLDENFKRSQRISGELATAQRDFTARIVLPNLPTDHPIFYRVTFQDPDQPKVQSEPVKGRLQIPGSRKDIFFAWSGDTAGQGWGINPKIGGMKIYESMRKLQPDFFIHSGDTVYADGPLVSEVKLDDGTLWHNLMTVEKSKVAETLTEFRGNYIYNLLDENIRRFNAEVPQLVQWDDHEVRNNWYPTQILEDDRYTVKSVKTLAHRAKQAFLEYQPLHPDNVKSEQIYRDFEMGDLLDVIMLDMRTHRAANSPNRQKQPSKDTAFLGREQLEQIKTRLKRSRATWKVIASDMPLGLMVRDGATDFENISNGDGPAVGREFELAELLRFIKREKIVNVVWLTADVHYAAAHYYDPDRAQFQDFNGFWEFVAGPLNSGTFGPGAFDNTFGPQLKFMSLPPGMKQNRPPSEGLQFFGTVRIDHQTRAMTVILHNIEGKPIYTIDLPAV
ncbi:MAG: alkaline phosphatase D family protein [Cyanobacteria bacterium]|nr:alkaline phosphatase D family protein [Cyanobacteriota bacterium]